MRMLLKLWRWWCELWDMDFCSFTEVDSHQWDNKAETLRRLSSGGG